MPAAAVASDAAGSERGPERFPRSQGRKPLQTSQRRAFVFSPGFKEEGGREEDERETRFGSRGNVNEVSVADEKKKKRKKRAPTYSRTGRAVNMGTFTALLTCPAPPRSPSPSSPARPVRGAASVTGPPRAAGPAPLAPFRAARPRGGGQRSPCPAGAQRLSAARHSPP